MKKAIRSNATGVYPVSADVEAHIRRVRDAHPDLVKVRRAGRSVEGRAIHAVTVTDPAVPAADKQHALIVGGQHGNEESGRMVALATIDWLVSRAAAATRRRQKVVVMPNVNPDGAEIDLHGNVNGVHPNLDHALSGAKTPEGKALEAVGDPLQPEVYIDLHACGGMGCGVDMTLWPITKNNTEDEHLLHQVASEMVSAGEKAGIPQTAHPLSWWGLEDIDAPSSTVYFYRNYKAMVLLTENTESNPYSYPAADRARAGLAKVRAVLAWGNRRHPKLPCPGYPGMLVGGLFHLGIVAVGRTAAARRRGRVAIWRNIRAFDRLGAQYPQPPDERTIHVKYSGERLRGVGIQSSVRGRRKVVAAKLNGRALRPSDTNGYRRWTAGCSTFVVVAIPDLRPGRHTIELAYD